MSNRFNNTDFVALPNVGGKRTFYGINDADLLANKMRRNVTAEFNDFDDDDVIRRNIRNNDFATNGGRFHTLDNAYFGGRNNRSGLNQRAFDDFDFARQARRANLVDDLYIDDDRDTRGPFNIRRNRVGDQVANLLAQGLHPVEVEYILARRAQRQAGNRFSRYANLYTDDEDDEFGVGRYGRGKRGLTRREVQEIINLRRAAAAGRGLDSVDEFISLGNLGRRGRRYNDVYDTDDDEVGIPRGLGWGGRGLGGFGAGGVLGGVTGGLGSQDIMGGRGFNNRLGGFNRFGGGLGADDYEDRAYIRALRRAFLNRSGRRGGDFDFDDEEDHPFRRALRRAIFLNSANRYNNFDDVNEDRAYLRSLRHALNNNRRIGNIFGAYGDFDDDYNTQDRSYARVLRQILNNNRRYGNAFGGYGDFDNDVQERAYFRALRQALNNTRRNGWSDFDDDVQDRVLLRALRNANPRGGLGGVGGFGGLDNIGAGLGGLNNIGGGGLNVFDDEDVQDRVYVRAVRNALASRLRGGFNNLDNDVHERVYIRALRNVLNNRVNGYGNIEDEEVADRILLQALLNNRRTGNVTVEDKILLQVLLNQLNRGTTLGGFYRGLNNINNLDFSTLGFNVFDDLLDDDIFTLRTRRRFGRGGNRGGIRDPFDDLDDTRALERGLQTLSRAARATRAAGASVIRIADIMQDETEELREDIGARF